MPRTNRPTKKPKDVLLPKLTNLFFVRWRMTAVIWLAVTVFGLLSYTTFLRREGFPSVDIPITIVGGSYLVNDPAKVDADVAAPLSALLLADSNVTKVQAQSSDNFFSLTVQYKEGTDAAVAATGLEKTVRDSGKIPASANLKFNVPYFGVTGGDTQQVDVAISFYDENGTATTGDLAAKATEAATWLRDRKLSLVKDVSIKNPYEEVAGTPGSAPAIIQRSFDRYGIRDAGNTKFYDSVIIAIAKTDDADIIKLDTELGDALATMQVLPQFDGYGAEISASFAPSIKDNIGELQRVLLEGLLAVLIVGSLVIAIRASVITVVSMVSVLLISLGLLYAIGYTLNVITLFALILSLALIVDDTIIMVEAIDAARGRSKDKRAAVKEATTRISRAMVAATLTAALSFAPLLFVGGILGSFIRAIPVTIIAALLISLVVALIFIPFFARFLLLSDKQMAKKRAKPSGASRFEARLAAVIARPMLWARNSSKRLVMVCAIAVVIGSSFIVGGLFVARGVIFNIFPPSKDTNSIAVSLNFPAGTTIDRAEAITADADALVGKSLGDNLVKASYYSSGSAQSATLQVELVSYSKRTVTSPELVKQLQTTFDDTFTAAQATVAQVDIGPPSAAFAVQITAANRESAFRAANDIASTARASELKRLDGSVAHLVNVTLSSPNQYSRTGDRQIVEVTARFDGDDTTTLVNLAQEVLKKDFNQERLATYGLKTEDVTFDLGQEEDNQDSFNTLVLAFPILLVAIFVLLAVQFRSLLQPLLIFMAIPFSLFGIMLGLRLTNNAISFFTMLGFFALVGLSIKNTILLTDYANQSRRSGASVIDAAVAALEERFRPLFATSMTAVVSLIPLAISSPFWEGLAVVLICGLLSSTFLVVTVFPYYYVVAEYLRGRFGRLPVVGSLIVFVGGLVLLGVLDALQYSMVWVLMWLLLLPVHHMLQRLLQRV